MIDARHGFRKVRTIHTGIALPHEWRDPEVHRLQPFYTVVQLGDARGPSCQRALMPQNTQCVVHGSRGGVLCSRCAWRGKAGGTWTQADALHTSSVVTKSSRRKNNELAPDVEPPPP